MAILAPRAGSGRLSRRHPQPARLAHVRAVAAVRPAAAVLRHQRRQHGLADQPLHGQQEGPQRRRLFARRPDRPAARPRHAALLPAGPRGLSRRAGHRRRRRGVAAPAGPLRLLERHRPPGDPARLPRPTCVVYGMGEQPDRRDRPTGWPPGETVKDLRDMRGVAYALGASEVAQSTAPSRRDRAAVVTRRSRPTSCTFAEATQDHPSTTNPLNAKTLVQFHDRQAVVVNPPPLPISQDEMDRDLRPALHAPAAPDRTRSRRSRPMR